MLTNCFRFAPRDSVPGLIAKICKYLKEHPGWSEEELEEQIKQIIGQNSVESFNGRTGDVILNDEDVNNLKIASAYFAEDDETIDDLNLKDLYNNGVRFVFTNWNSLTSAYDLAFVLEYVGGSDSVVYYPMATGSGGGSVISVNGKTGVVTGLYDAENPPPYPVTSVNGGVGNVKITSFDGVNNKIVMNDGSITIGLRFLLDKVYKAGLRFNTGLPLKNGYYQLEVVNEYENRTSPVYTAYNPPPYPVTSVNGETGAVTGLYSAKTPPPYPVTSVNNRNGAVKGLANSNFYTSSPGERIDFFNPDSDIALIVLKDGNVRVWNGVSTVSELYSNVHQPPYPVTSVDGKTGSVTSIITIFAPDSVENEEYSITIPKKTCCLLTNALCPFSTDSTTLPAGNEDGITIVCNDVYPGDLMAGYFNRGYVMCSNTAKNNTTAILNYKNFGSSACPLKYGFNILFVNNRSVDVQLTIKGYH